MRFTAALLSVAACSHAPASTPPPRAPVAAVRLVAINDFHGNLEAPRGGLKVGNARIPAGGAGYLAAHIAAVKTQHPEALVVSAGDLIGASPLLSALFHDEPTVEAMNELGLDINGVGNHEFDEGLAELLRMKKGGCHPKDGCRGGKTYQGARFDFLAANVLDDKTGTSVFPATTLRKMNGVMIGFIGLTLEGTADILPPHAVPGLSFRDEAVTANAHAKRLQAEGAQVVVVLLHEGGFAQSQDPNACAGLSGPVVDIVDRLDPAIDVVISGHTHQAYVCRRGAKLLTSAGSFGRMVTEIEIFVDAERGVVGAAAENRVVDHSIPPDDAVESLVAGYRTLAAPLANRVVAQVEAPLDRKRNAAGMSALGRVIADAQLEATRSAGAEIAFMNAGGIRTAVAPELGKDGLGEVTYGMLFGAQPFGNLLVTLSLSGREVLEILEAQFADDRNHWIDSSSSLQYTWRAKAPLGARIVEGSVRIDGAPLGLERTYRVTVNAYMAGRGLFAKGRDRANGKVDLEALVDYLAARSPLPLPSLDGVSVLD